MKGLERAKKNWTDEELDYLEKWFGKRSKQEIAKHLHRSLHAVRWKAQELGLGMQRDYEGLISITRLCAAIKGTDRHGVSGDNVKHFKKLGIPSQRVQLGGKPTSPVYEMIDIEDFWKWLKDNPNKISIAKLEENILGKEPEFVKILRRQEWDALAKRRWSCGNTSRTTKSMPPLRQANCGMSR